MTDRDWKRVEELFLAAIERPKDRRDAWLERECGPDRETLREVRELLERDQEHEGLDGDGGPDTVQESIRSALRDASAGTAARPGERIGPYRIERELGRGGMGRVYLAVRDDDTFHKRVALKRMRGGLWQDELDRRFRNERRILARLEHPGIARILDGGGTEDGEPYVVMEYVEGVPLDRYVRENRPDLRARLGLFLQICDAVDHAHRHLVVHRDLKPANVLVTPEGRVKLLDFGIAKLLEPEPTAERSLDTRPALRLLTPDYASPEQIRGEPVHVATDVYSLGVVLYELLTGVRPFAGGSRSQAEVERAVLEETPSRPSRVAGAGTGTGPTGGNRPAEPGERLSTDLDAIVLNALRKEPDRRYDSVRALAEDVERYLRHEPVRARPITPGYRAGRFVRRHRGATVAALAVVVAVGAGVAFHTDRLGRERDLARQGQSRAEQVQRFLEDLFRVASPGESRGETITVREVLDDARDRLPGTLQDQPAVRAQLLRTLGVVYTHLGLPADGAPLVEEAVALEREHGTARSLAAALIARAELVALARDHAAALASSEEAFALLRSELPEDHPEAIEALGLVGAARMRLQENEAARDILTHVLDLQRRATPDDVEGIARTLDGLAIAQLRLGESDAAYRNWRSAFELSESALGEDHPQTLHYLGQIEYSLRDQGRYAEAEPFNVRNLALHERVLGPDHPQTAAERTGLAHIYHATGRYEQALALRRRSLESFVRTYGTAHSYVALMHSFIGRDLLALGRFDDARHHFEEELRIKEADPETPPGRIVAALVHLAEVAYMRGDEVAFVRGMERAAERTDRPAGSPGGSWLGDATFALYHAYRGEPDAVLGCLVDLFADEERNGADKAQSEYLLRAATALVRIDRADRARPLVDEALDTYEATLGFDEPSARRHLARFLSALEARDDPAAAAWSREIRLRTGENSH